MPKPFTVIGFWDDGDRRHVIGVIEGEHDVMGGASPGEGGLFADYVEAETWEEAEEKTHGTREQEEEDVRGCSCGMADYGAPGHDGHKEEGD